MKLALVGIYTSLILDEDTNHHMPVLSQILGLPEHHWGVPLGGRLWEQYTYKNCLEGKFGR